MNLHTFVFCLCVFLFYLVFVCVCVCAPRGETGCVGCYLLLQRVTANHQPWQTLGERREGRRRRRGGGGGEMTIERERRDRGRGETVLGRGIDIWILLSNHRVFRILSSQPLYVWTGAGRPARFRPTTVTTNKPPPVQVHAEAEGAPGNSDEMRWINPCVCVCLNSLAVTHTF